MSNILNKVAEILTKRDIPFVVGEKGLYIPEIMTDPVAFLTADSEKEVRIQFRHSVVVLPIEMVGLRCKAQYQLYLRDKEYQSRIENYHSDIEKMLAPLIKDFMLTTGWAAEYRPTGIQGELHFRLKGSAIALAFPNRSWDFKTRNPVATSGITYYDRHLSLEDLTAVMPALLDLAKKADELVTDDFLASYNL